MIAHERYFFCIYDISALFFVNCQKKINFQKLTVVSWCFIKALTTDQPVIVILNSCMNNLYGIFGLGLA